MNPLKSQLKDNQPCIGAWLNSGSSLVAEAMASCGFQWLAIDMEHSAVDLSQVEAIFTSTERWGVSTVVRIGAHDPLLACRLLDSGAQGLIISKVEDVSEFEKFTKRCLYPPLGSRGVGLGRANLWGDNFDDYFQNFQPVLMPMIETMKGVAVAKEIAALPMVDGLFLGPYDLSTDCGDAGKLGSKNFLNSVQLVRQACVENKKAVGIHQVKPDLAELNSRINESFGFIAFGTDLLAVRHTFQDIREIQD